LFQLGRWLFQEYLDADWFEIQDVEFLAPYVEDFGTMLQKAGVSTKDRTLRPLHRLLARPDFNPVWELPPKQATTFKTLLHERFDALCIAHKDVLSIAEEAYAANYANRVFHDRELCGYIAELILEIGIDGTTEDEEPSQWCARSAIPAWAKKAVIARDRGKCSQCGSDVVLELEDDSHIDHIVPLSRGGCNDLVNLQLLCGPCNLTKASGRVDVTSSVPQYIMRLRKLRIPNQRPKHSAQPTVSAGAAKVARLKR
jgi:HNH endonuclease